MFKNSHAGGYLNIVGGAKTLNIEIIKHCTSTQKSTEKGKLKLAKNSHTHHFYGFINSKFGQLRAPISNLVLAPAAVVSTNRPSGSVIYRNRRKG